MFSTEEFQSWAKENVVLFASIMTKIPDRKEDDLLTTYGFRGFPSLAILQKDGEAITKKVDRDLGAMKLTVMASSWYPALKAKVDAGEDFDKAKWFVAQLGLGKLDLKAAKEQLATVKLEGDLAKTADQAILSMEINDVIATFRKTRDQDVVAQKALALYKAGRRPGKSHPMHGFYVTYLAKGAELMDDAEAYKWAAPQLLTMHKERLAKTRKDMADPKYKDNERAQAYFPRAIEQLEKEIEKVTAKLKELGN